MNDLIKVLSDLMVEARKKAAFTPTSQKMFTWKHCVVLAKAGWKATEYKKIGNEDSDGIMVIWKKNGHKDLGMPLSFAEQCKWIKYMENKAKGEHNDK